MSGRSPFSVFQNPEHRAYRVATMATHLPSYALYYLRLKQSRYGRLIPKGDPFFERKFVTPYLAMSLTARERLRIQTHLFETLEHRFTGADFLDRLKAGIVLWRATTEAGEQTVTLSLPVRTMLEGDLLLEHAVDGTTLYRFSFAFVPAGVMGPRETMVVGGSQGVHGTGLLTRSAAKANGEINPAATLMIALRALCQAMGIDDIHGVRADNQPVVHAKADHNLGAYDTLWAQHGGVPSAGFYVMEAQLSDASQSLDSGHKSRTRRKRRLKQAILSDILQALAPYAGGEIVPYDLPIAAE